MAPSPHSHQMNAHLRNLKVSFKLAYALFKTYFRVCDVSIITFVLLELLFSHLLEIFVKKKVAQNDKSLTIESTISCIGDLCLCLQKKLQERQGSFSLGPAKFTQLLGLTQSLRSFGIMLKHASKISSKQILKQNNCTPM